MVIISDYNKYVYRFLVNIISLGKQCTPARNSYKKRKKKWVKTMACLIRENINPARKHFQWETEVDEIALFRRGKKPKCIKDIISFFLLFSVGERSWIWCKTVYFTSLNIESNHLWNAFIMQPSRKALNFQHSYLIVKNRQMITWA